MFPDKYHNLITGGNAMNRFFSVIALAVVVLAGCSTETDVSNPLFPTQSNSSTSASNEAEALVDAGSIKTYRVTIENLLTGQPLSPGVLVTHTKKANLFRVGELATEGIRLIAEDGDPSVAVAELTGQPGVYNVVPTSAPIHRVGGPGPTSLTVEIMARANANRLSLATMLICTNDGFTGLDGVKLPGGFMPDVYLSAGYDAGTEANDELSTSIVDPCGVIGPVPMAADGNSRTATSGVITHHPGIQGGASLSTAQHGWQDPVARITIQRIK